MTSTLPPLVQAFSGAISSASANAIAYPLDLIATRLQTTSSRKLRGFSGILLTLKHILQTEGWRGLYDGIGTDTSATLLSNFLYFYFYTSLRTVLVRRKARMPSFKPPNRKTVPMLLSITEELGIGFLAGVASRAISTPLSVITVRLQTETEDEDKEGSSDAENGSPNEAERVQRPQGAILTIKKIYEEEGLQGFWAGFTTTIPLSLNPAITLFLFQVYRQLSSHYASTPGTTQSQRRDQKLATPNARSAFFGAACANTIAIAILYPLILAKTRLQVHRKNGEGHENMISVWCKALKQEGLAGVYQGLDAQIVKGFVSQGVTMMVKQRIELLIVILYLRSLKRST